MEDRHKVIAILGPTGSGKSELALRVAAGFSGRGRELRFFADVPLFRHRHRQTPCRFERRGIPHHLIDILDPDQVFTAGEYARLARGVLAEISARGRLARGGRWHRFLFARAARWPVSRGRRATRPCATAWLQRERRRPGSIHRLLRRFDPQAARRIHPHDLPKLMRALEVCLLTRRPVTEIYQEGRDELRGYESSRSASLRRGNNSMRGSTSVAEQMFRDRPDRGSARHSGARLCCFGQAVRIARLPPGRTVFERRVEPGRSRLLRATQHATLRQAPDDLVSPGAGDRMVLRFWRRTANSAGIVDRARAFLS